MTSIIEDLEEQVEYWRARAEAAEAIVAGQDWARAVPPLSLYQTRILRLLGQRDVMAKTLLAKMELDYPNTTDNCLKSQICLLRAKLPAVICPPLKSRGSVPYTIPDREALRVFLDTGVLPAEQRRAA